MPKRAAPLPTMPGFGEEPRGLAAVVSDRRHLRLVSGALIPCTPMQSAGNPGRGGHTMKARSQALEAPRRGPSAHQKHGSARQRAHCRRRLHRHGRQPHSGFPSSRCSSLQPLTADCERRWSRQRPAHRLRPNFLRLGSTFAVSLLGFVSTGAAKRLDVLMWYVGNFAVGTAGKPRAVGQTEQFVRPQRAQRDGRLVLFRGA